MKRYETPAIKIMGFKQEEIVMFQISNIAQDSGNLTQITLYNS